MEPLRQKLQDVIGTASVRLQQISEADSAHFPAPGQWSKKQILGHLIDSAANNHQRFVRVQLTNGLSLLGYAQNDWVDAQPYNRSSWRDLLVLWSSYNRHLVHVIAHLPEATLTHTVRVSESEPVTLRFLVEDYVQHLQHHLRQILD